MFVVDTNILVYASDADSPFCEPCRASLEKWQAEPSPWHLTWGCLYEFLRITTHPQVLRKPYSVQQAWAFIEALLQSPSLSVLSETPLHADILRQTMEELPEIRGNLVFDARTAVLMREHGIRTIYTRDKHFRQFPFLRAIDPAMESA